MQGLLDMLRRALRRRRRARRRRLHGQGRLQAPAPRCRHRRSSRYDRRHRAPVASADPDAVRRAPRALGTRCSSSRPASDRRWASREGRAEDAAATSTPLGDRAGAGREGARSSAASTAARSSARCSATTSRAASIPGEIVPGEAFYSLRGQVRRRQPGRRLRIPAPLDERHARARCARSPCAPSARCECTGMARVDFFHRARHRHALTSTSSTPSPGFTSISMYPKLWEAIGRQRPGARHAPAAALAIERHAARQRLRDGERATRAALSRPARVRSTNESWKRIGAEAAGTEARAERSYMCSPMRL